MAREPDRRGSRRRDSTSLFGGNRAAQDRTRIAQATARLIAEHGITDWAAAKRKAARQLGVPEHTSLPSNEDIQQALTDYHSLFADEAHTASLHTQRTAALRWMRRLERWSPVLVGGVAAGWATAHSDVRIELVADDPKTVEMTLVGANVRYNVVPPRSDNADPQSAELLIEGSDVNVRLSILSPNQRRNRPRRADEPRFDITELSRLLQDD